MKFVCLLELALGMRMEKKERGANGAQRRYFVYKNITMYRLFLLAINWLCHTALIHTALIVLLLRYYAEHTQNF